MFTGYIKRVKVKVSCEGLPNLGTRLVLIVQRQSDMLRRVAYEANKSEVNIRLSYAGINS